MMVGGSNTISFTIEGTSYQAEEGMTWKEWINSDYNTDGFIRLATFILNSMSNGAVKDPADEEGNTQNPTDEIKSINYILV